MTVSSTASFTVLSLIVALRSPPCQDRRGPPSGHCKSAWQSAADGGAVWSSFSALNGSTAVTHYVLAINVSRPFLLSWRDLWPRPAASGSMVFLSRRWAHTSSCTNGSAAVGSGRVSH